MKRALLAVLGVLVCLSVALSAAPPRRTAHPANDNPDPIVGNVQSPVRVIIYQDLECPSCAEWHGDFVHQIIPEYGSRVGFEFRDFPLPQHVWSFNAAVLARFFDTRSVSLGMAWRDYCFTHQDDITPDNLLPTAASWAAPHGFTQAELAQVFSRSDLFKMVQHDQALGNRDHVEHTPTVLLNGVEATTPAQLVQMLNQALARH